MHRLRTRKKSNKDIGDSKDDTATGNVTKASTSRFDGFKRNKSQPPPVTRQPLDLSQALPSNDDFRISLMMPKLEGRFSILKGGDGKGNETETKGPGPIGIGYGALASGTLYQDDKSSSFS